MESEKLSLTGEVSSTSAEARQGRRVGWLAVASMSEGSSPQLLLTSQARDSWDPLLCMMARCCSPFLLEGNQQKGEQAKQLTANQPRLLDPTTSYRHCAPDHSALQLICSPHSCLCEGQDLSSVCGSSLHSEHGRLPLKKAH